MRVLIAAGGTAGHINPALAIAGALKAADPTAEIYFAGRREGMEYGLVTKAGYPFHHIEINGFQRKINLENIGRNIVAVWHLALSGPRTKKILNEVQPDLVIVPDWGDIAKVETLRDLGLKVVVCKGAKNLSEIKETIRLIAQAVGEPERGERLHSRTSPLGSSSIFASSPNFAGRASAPPSGVQLCPKSSE